jgi:hypothetical protein
MNNVEQLARYPVVFRRKNTTGDVCNKEGAACQKDNYKRQPGMI